MGALCGSDVIRQNPLSQLQRSTQPQPLARSPSVDQGLCTLRQAETAEGGIDVRREARRAMGLQIR